MIIRKNAFARQIQKLSNARVHWICSSALLKFLENNKITLLFASNFGTNQAKIIKKFASIFKYYKLQAFQ